jgi:hypothetical protein
MLCASCQTFHQHYKKQYITPTLINHAINLQNLNLLDWLYDMIGAHFDCHNAIHKNNISVLKWMSTKLGVVLWKVDTLSIYIRIISIDVLNIYDENDYDFSRSRLNYLAKINKRIDILEWLDQRAKHRIKLGQDILDYKGPDRSYTQPYSSSRFGGFVDL